MNARTVVQVFAPAALAGLTLVACGPTAGAPKRVERAPMPERLSQTGLYIDIATRTLAPGVWPFEPQYPLWTDGAKKQRWIQVPPGTSIDASDPDCWIFPVGTKLWKEFAFERQVETRMLEKHADGSWLRLAFVWSDDGSEAFLAPDAGVRGAAEAAPGVPYDVPSRMDCVTCHARGDGVLGFGALQLSSERDPLALHSNPNPPAGQDLAAFVARGLIRALPEEHLVNPPRIAGRTPRERAALGYLHTHCGSCHWNGGLLGGLELTLDATLGTGFPQALATTLGRSSRFRPADAPHCEVRLHPGAPEHSAIFYRMSTREPMKQMPPLGTRLVDTEARDLIEAWIREDLAVELVSAALN